MSKTKETIAIVTGSNKGIGFEIVRQLASNGITVILTARDEKRGLEALEKLKEQKDISEKVIFHQLDVSDPSSVSTLAHFVKTRFGKLDILVNNAGISGIVSSPNSGVQSVEDMKQPWRQTYELAEECLQINYYGAKRMVEAFIPILELSDSPRIVNVSSTLGKLLGIKNDWAKKVLSSDVESLTIEAVDEVLSQFLKDFKDGSLEAKGWPSVMPAYIVSKAAMNAYTRILANAHRGILVNSVCPGFVKTDLNSNLGVLSTEEGAASPVRLALLPKGDEAPSGLFFDRSEVSSF